VNGNESGLQCVFCRIADGREPATILHSDECVVAVVPSKPSARVHILIVPRRHLSSIDALMPEDRDLWWHLLEVAQQLARQQGIDIEGEGYHLVTNAGRHSTRAFPHLHIHVASGALL